MNPRNLSPRKILEAISNGGLKPKYIGKHTFETLDQMQFSLFNAFKPQTMNHREIRDWLAKLIGVYDATKQDIEEPKEKEILLSKIYKKLESFVTKIDSNKDKALVSAICEMSQCALHDLEEEKSTECEEPKKEIKEFPKDGLIREGNPNDGNVHQP